ncbi:hypothetical protein Dimus_033190 [Dionaea muscipula]
MRRMGRDKNLRFHPRCKGLRIINLCFTFDLMIFSKTHDDSLRLLQVLASHGEGLGFGSELKQECSSFGGVGHEKHVQLAGSLVSLVLVFAWCSLNIWVFLLLLKN